MNGIKERKGAKNLIGNRKAGKLFAFRTLIEALKTAVSPIFSKPQALRGKPLPFRKIAVFLILQLPLFSFPATAKIVINIGSAKVKKSVIALSPFVLRNNSADREELKIGEAMFSHLNENLKFSGYFKILTPEAFIEDPTKKSPLPRTEDARGFRWENWRLAGADFLLLNNYTLMEGQVQLRVSFYDINLKRAVFKRKYTASTQHTEQLINRLSNDIVERLSGRKGIFETRIAAVRTVAKGQKELFIMNWNGKEPRRLTFHRSIVLSPVWSPDGKHIAYTAFVYNKKQKANQAMLFLYERKTKLIRVLSKREGANLGADFSPNGKSLFITLGIGRGLMDIFKLNISNSRIIPLTNGPRGAINVEPALNSRGNLMAFSSNKSGKAHIYTMTPKGEQIRQITFAGHYNATPNWSPVQNKLVFSGKDRGWFDIFMLNGDGTGLKRLTHLKKANGRRANCESPHFSPDGRFIVFTSDVTGAYQLYIMNLDDLAIERITFDRWNYKAPKWSPYL